MQAESKLLLTEDFVYKISSVLRENATEDFSRNLIFQRFEAPVLLTSYFMGHHRLLAVYRTKENVLHRSNKFNWLEVIQSIFKLDQLLMAFRNYTLYGTSKMVYLNQFIACVKVPSARFLLLHYENVTPTMQTVFILVKIKWHQSVIKGLFTFTYAWVECFTTLKMQKRRSRFDKISFFAHGNLIGFKVHHLWQMIAHIRKRYESIVSYSILWKHPFHLYR